ncbi:MAG: hypothetical protein RMK94_16955, partial [Armatimonadota bacterium]|nr:hypothetical protein [Armatimonadota bacterium]
MGRKESSNSQSKPMAHSPVPKLATPEKRTIPLAFASIACVALPVFLPSTFPLAWIGLVPFLVALNFSRWQMSLIVSLIFGSAFHGAANYWLIPTIAELGPYTESPNQPMLFWAIFGFVALVLWQSLFVVLFGLIVWSVL